MMRVVDAYVNAAANQRAEIGAAQNRIRSRAREKILGESEVGPARRSVRRGRCLVAEFVVDARAPLPVVHGIGCRRGPVRALQLVGHGLIRQRVFAQHGRPIGLIRLEGMRAPGKLSLVVPERGARIVDGERAAGAVQRLREVARALQWRWARAPAASARADRGRAPARSKRRCGCGRCIAWESRPDRPQCSPTDGIPRAACEAQAVIGPAVGVQRLPPFIEVDRAVQLVGPAARHDAHGAAVRVAVGGVEHGGVDFDFLYRIHERERSRWSRWRSCLEFRPR